MDLINNYNAVLFGGMNSKFELLNDLWLFNLESENWKKIEIEYFCESPISRIFFSSSLSSFEKNKKIVYFGGLRIDKSKFNILNDSIFKAYFSEKKSGFSYFLNLILKLNSYIL